MSKRKYVRGDSIRSFDELEQQTFIMFHNKVLHIGFWGSWQYRMLKTMINRGVLYKVEPIPKANISIWDVIGKANNEIQSISDIAHE